MSRLHKVHTYYQFSLNSFVYFFLLGIATASGRKHVEEEEEKDDHKKIELEELEEQIAKRINEIEEKDKADDGSKLPERLTTLKQHITQVVYEFIRTGLFEKDKLTVVTMICMSIMVDEVKLCHDVMRLHCILPSPSNLSYFPLLFILHPPPSESFTFSLSFWPSSFRIVHLLTLLLALFTPKSPRVC
jgi:hypothetical protein